MKRIAIFSFYDKEGIADAYIKYLLSELCTVAERLVIVVNGKLTLSSRKMFECFTNDIYIRDNIGFDIGAYTDTLIGYLEENEIYKWDELIFCNDTFYGPFIRMKDIFRQMEVKNTEFWGLNFVDRGMLSHIQSYFLVFGKKIIESGALLYYLQHNINIFEKEIKNVYARFEMGIFAFLKNRGYSFSTYANTNLYDIYASPELCIKKCGLPILKKKCFYNEGDSCKYLMCTLKNIYNRGYNINYILENANRLYGFNCNEKEILKNEEIVDERENNQVLLGAISESSFLNWINGKEFYIYGTGIIARDIFYLYHEKMKGFKGFVISNNQKKEKELFGYPVFYYSEINSSSNIVMGIAKPLMKDILLNMKTTGSILTIWQ